MKKILIGVGVGIILLLAFFWLNRVNENQNINPPQKTPIQSNKILTPKQDIFHFLLLGYGGGEHQGGKLSDTNLLVKIDTSKKKILLVNLPRDLYVQIPLEFPPIASKLNAAFALGEDKKQYKKRHQIFNMEQSGIRTMSAVVEEIIANKIDATLVFNFSTFIGVIDSIGGVEVNVPFTFTDRYYPIEGQERESCGKSEAEIEQINATLSADLAPKEFPCRFEELHFQKGPQILDGMRSLKYLRSRKADVGGNDFGRSLRLESLLLGFQKKMLSPSYIGKIPKTFAMIIKSTQSDLQLKNWLELYTQLGSLDQYQIETKVLSLDNVLKESRSSDRQYILVPREGVFEYSGIRQFISEN